MTTHLDSLSAAPKPGHAEPVRDAQAVFRAVLDALSHPGRVFPLPGSAQAPDALGTGLADIALTLLDADSSVWLHPSLAADPEIPSYLTFHTGVRQVTEVCDAEFVIASPQTIPALEELEMGTDEAPHRSATVVVDARSSSTGGHFVAEGPGIDGTIEFDAHWAPASFIDLWQQNAAAFPRGVDLLAVDEYSVVALPRTTRLRAASQKQEA